MGLSSHVILLGLLAAMTTLLGVPVARTPRQASIELTTPYQTVLRTNGQILFGKLDQPAAAHPVLRNVFYLQSQANPETRQMKTMALKSC
jgi:hypothetical protein